MDKVKKKINDGGFYKERILYLVQNMFDGNEAQFLREAELSHNYLQSMKKKDNPIPSVDAVNKMINAAKKKEKRFNPLWLIKDDVRMILPKTAEKKINNGNNYDSDINEILRLLDKIESYPDELKKSVFPSGFPVKLSQLATKFYKLQLEDNTDSDE